MRVGVMMMMLVNVGNMIVVVVCVVWSYVVMICLVFVWSFDKVGNSIWFIGVMIWVNGESIVLYVSLYMLSEVELR